ncbi:MAG: hypothetical protein LBH29_07785, partial [Elusimicrobiota bacterium]|nr:hypothetical protein [Elusimicrobiota bacterium]
MKTKFDVFTAKQIGKAEFFKCQRQTANRDCGFRHNDTQTLCVCARRNNTDDYYKETILNNKIGKTESLVEVLPIPYSQKFSLR